jgi:hypothetical protein
LNEQPYLYASLVPLLFPCPKLFNPNNHFLKTFRASLSETSFMPTQSYVIRWTLACFGITHGKNTNLQEAYQVVEDIPTTRVFKLVPLFFM